MKIAFLLLVLPPFVSVARAQDPGLAWQDRGDRYEGIKRRPVGGERFDFVGVRVPSTLEGSPPVLFLSVSRVCRIDDADRVDVRDDSHYYWMTPKDKESLNAGPFQWTSDILSKAGVQVEKLRVTVRNESTGTYCPARLSTSGDVVPVGEGGYIFSFRTAADVRLQWEIVSLDSGASVASGMTQGDLRGCEIQWDGSAPSGHYQLRVTGRGESQAGEFKIAKAVDFLHGDAWR